MANFGSALGGVHPTAFPIVNLAAKFRASPPRVAIATAAVRSYQPPVASQSIPAPPAASAGTSTGSMFATLARFSSPSAARPIFTDIRSIVSRIAAVSSPLGAAAARSALMPTQPPPFAPYATPSVPMVDSMSPAQAPISASSGGTLPPSSADAAQMVASMTPLASGGGGGGGGFDDGSSSSDTAPAPAASSGPSGKQLLVYGALGVGGLFLLSKLFK